MYDFLTHLYKRGTRPFRTLSSLPEAQAISLMKSLYIEGSIAWERFNDPAKYLSCRRIDLIGIQPGGTRSGPSPRPTLPTYRPGFRRRLRSAVTTYVRAPRSAACTAHAAYARRIMDERAACRDARGSRRASPECEEVAIPICRVIPSWQLAGPLSNRPPATQPQGARFEEDNHVRR